MPLQFSHLTRSGARIGIQIFQLQPNANISSFTHTYSHACTYALTHAHRDKDIICVLKPKQKRDVLYLKSPIYNLSFFFGNKVTTPGKETVSRDESRLWISKIWLGADWAGKE